MEESKDKMNISSNSNDLLLQIENKLNQIIEYIQNNLINIQNKDKNFDENETQNKRKVKLGIKRKRLRKSIENEENKDKTEINLNENENNNKIILKNKKLKTKIKKYKKHAIEIVKKVKDILLKINDNKNVNLGEFNINNVQELNDENGKYIGNVKNDKREGKGIMNYNNGDRYKGDWKNGNLIGLHVTLTQKGEVKTENY